MPSVKSPTVSVFASTFSQQMRAAASGIAGSDGKLTFKELSKAMATDRVPRHLRDNLFNYFDKSGLAESSREVSASQLAADAFRYAERAAKSAAGSNGILSAAEVTKLPTDLRADYAVIKAATHLSTPKLTREQALKAALTELLGGANSDLTREITSEDFQRGAVPSEVLATIENQGEREDGDYEAEYHFVYSGSDQRTVIGYAITTTRRDGEFTTKSTEILDARGEVLTSDSVEWE